MHARMVWLAPTFTLPITPVLTFINVSRCRAQVERVRGHEKLFNQVSGARGVRRALTSRGAQVWAQCQRCQSSLHQDVLCTR